MRAPFCIMRYINEGLSLPVDEAPELERAQCVRKNIVDFYRTEFPGSCSAFNSYKILAVRALYNIAYRAACLQITDIIINLFGSKQQFE